jgi:phosphoglycolate phosphatase
VLFDLDGTLVDTAPDLYRAACRLCARLAHPEPSFERFRPTVSRGARAMLACAFPDRPEAERESLVEPFLALYREDVCRESRLFPGIETVLAALGERGLPWGIVTNKPRFLTEPLLAALPLAAAPAVLFCGDCLPVRKPDPAPVLAACAVLGRSPLAVWFVGDDERDVQAGRAAGCRTAVAGWGYVPGAGACLQWGSERVLERPDQLLALLEGG